VTESGFRRVLQAPSREPYIHERFQKKNDKGRKINGGHLSKDNSPANDLTGDSLNICSEAHPG
jgi:hypothetical protein